MEYSLILKDTPSTLQYPFFYCYCIFPSSFLPLICVMFSSEYSATAIFSIYPTVATLTACSWKQHQKAPTATSAQNQVLIIIAFLFCNIFAGTVLTSTLDFDPKAKTRKESAHFRLLTTLSVRDNCLLACVPGRTGCTKRHACAYIDRQTDRHVLKYKLAILSCVTLRDLYVNTLSISVEGYKLEKWAVVARKLKMNSSRRVM